MTVDLPQGAACGRHPGRSAVEHCPTCGDHLCETCAGLACEAPDCPRCVDRAAGPWAVPWEAAGPSRVRALASTAVGILLSPRRFFRALPERGPVGPALGFAAAAFTLGTLPYLVVVVWPELPAALIPFALFVAAVPFLGLYRAVGTGLLIWAGCGILVRPVPAAPVLRVVAYGLAADLLLPLGGLGLYAAAALHAVGLRETIGLRWWQSAVIAAIPLVFVHMAVLGGLALYLTLAGKQW